MRKGSKDAGNEDGRWQTQHTDNCDGCGLDLVIYSQRYKNTHTPTRTHTKQLASATSTRTHSQQYKHKATYRE